MSDVAGTVRGLAEGLDRPFAYADVGARWGAADHWRGLLPTIQIVAFKPDPEECERLRALGDGVRYESVALGATAGEATLHVTRDPACSSLYPPDPAAFGGHDELQGAAPASTRRVVLETLDAWGAGAGVSFDALKLDVQGAELDVLRGAERQLREVVMLEVEVEFNPLLRASRCSPTSTHS